MFFKKKTHKGFPEDLIKSKTYCVHLFSQVATSPFGYLRPCCHFKDKNSKDFHISKISPSGFFNSLYFKGLRKKVNKGVKLKGCTYCYSMEENNVESMRQRHNRDYFEIVKKVRNNVQQKNIYSFDLRLGNLCNLGCIMCHPDTSSFLEQEQKKNHNENFFGVLPNSFDLMKWYKEPSLIQDIKNDTGNITKLWLLGGEPLINMGNLEILENLKSKGKSLEIEVSSNITFLNKRILDLFSRYNTIVKCSIDGFGPVSDYIRYPSVFRDIDRNFQILFQTNIKVEVVFSVQIFNLFNIKDLYFWLKNICEKFSKPCDLSVNIIVYPDHLAIRNLPKTVKIRAIKKLQEILLDIKSSEKQYIRPIGFLQLVNYLEKEEGDVTEIQKGWKFIESLDKIRKKSWRDVIPWVEKIL